MVESVIGPMLLACDILAVYSTPYFEAFRFVFDLLPALPVLTVGIELTSHPFHQGYSLTARTP